MPESLLYGQPLKVRQLGHYECNDIPGRQQILG